MGYGGPTRNTLFPTSVTMPNLVGQTVRVHVETRTARKYRPLASLLSRSLKVIETDTDQSATYYFLLVTATIWAYSRTVSETKVFLCLSVLELGPMYAIDRQTDVRQKHRLISPPINRSTWLRLAGQRPVTCYITATSMTFDLSIIGHWGRSDLVAVERPSNRTQVVDVTTHYLLSRNITLKDYRK